MLKLKDRLKLEIIDFTNEGMGVAKHDGIIIFVPMCVTGDIIEAEITHVKASYAYAKALQIIEDSKHRRTPPCSAYKNCGGCQMMHINYDYQIELKKKFIYNCLVRLGKCDKNINIDMIPFEKEFGYRNKMVYPVGKNKKGETVCGFYAVKSHNIVPLDDCMLGLSSDSEIIKTLLSYMAEYNIAPYNEEKHSGIIRRLFIRRGKASGETMVVISANAKELKGEEALCKALTSADTSITSIILNTNEKKTNLVLGDKNRTLLGCDLIHDKLFDINYEISPHSFFQINPVQTENLYAKALEFADVSKDDVVMDVYCGIGTISLTASKNAKKVIGIEIVPKAIEDAKKNATNNHINNADFYVGEAENIVPKLIEDGLKPDIVILDPPRKGSDEKTLSAIVKSAPKRISYVSCNPATLARDVKFLTENGYSPAKVCGVDMFPETLHVETVVLMTRTD